MAHIFLVNQKRYPLPGLDLRTWMGLGKRPSQNCEGIDRVASLAAHHLTRCSSLLTMVDASTIVVYTSIERYKGIAAHVERPTRRHEYGEFP